LGKGKTTKKGQNEIKKGLFHVANIAALVLVRAGLLIP
jgi:hypothetical protein